MTTIGTPTMYLGFLAFVLTMLAIDLGVFHRKAHEVKFKEALGWSIVWIALSLLFAGGVYHWYGDDVAKQFLTGYIIEKALSVDNIFVILVLFSYFKVPSDLRHRVLFWGILGALIMRAGFIFAGAALIQRFSWVMYVFGAILIYTAIKLVAGNDEPEPEKNPVLRLIRRFVPTTADYRGQHFFVMENGKRFATPLFLVLATVEATDLVFALDSIPAIFAITTDPFIVFTSNIFAVLGLRALFFLLATVIGKFRFLKYGLALVLAFVGLKMLLSKWIHVPVELSLLLVTLFIGGSVVVSALFPASPEKVES
jgi:tellurite resistance protein TerC